MNDLITYLAMDRRFALAGDDTLSDRAQGAALFVDISGFTPLTEALVHELGPQRGAEELTRYLNLVYDAIINELHDHHGSVIAFAGDAITCWLDGDNGLAATACALAMQRAMHQFSAITTPAGNTVNLAMKAAVAAGPARRFLVGDPALRVIDALAGATLVRLANAEHQAQRGEVVIDGATLETLASAIDAPERRHDSHFDQTVGVVRGLHQTVTPTPWPTLPATALADETLRPWLLPQVYERLRRGMGNFLAELRPTVALFVRFTGIDYDADDAAGARLDAYIRWVQEVVARYEGTLIDLNIGDKGSYLYINFGAPLAHEDNVDRAAAAALTLQNRPDALHYIEPIQIGISQGQMRAGAYGGTHHRTYGVLGDEVNMAARLMMAAKPGQTLMSEAARRSLSPRFMLENLPPIRVKGKRAPAVIFALTGVQEVGGGQLLVPAYALPMIGRQEALQLATEKLARATTGHGQLLYIAGEAGMGKSRLVAEILRLGADQGFASYGGECESYGTNSSYLVWQPIWRGLFGLDSSAFSAQQLATLLERLARVHPTFPARAPLLEPVLNLPIADNEFTNSLDPKLRKTLLEELLVACLRTFAEQQPLLIVLEACQWVDPLSYELWETVTPVILELPVLLLFVSRQREREAQSRSAITATRTHYTEIQLAPLTATEAADFVALKVAQLLGTTAPPTDQLVNLVTAHAEGNPFYLEELLTYLHYRGVDFQDSAALARVELPDSLQRLTLSLLDQFSESQKITIKVASVIGRLFQAAWLAGIYPELGAADHIRADLTWLQQHELLLREAEPELTYRFRQVITQSVTYESLPHALKELLHQQIGAFVEQRYPDAIDQYLDLLAYHYDHSTDETKRRHYLWRAGEAAQAAYANAVALNYFTRLLAVIPRAEQGAVQLKLGQIQDTVGRYREAEEHFHAALALATQSDERSLVAQSQIALGELRRKQSQYEEAAVCFVKAQTIAEQIGDETSVAKALVCGGSLALYRGDYTAAHDHYTKGLAIRRRLDDHSQVANTLSDLAIVTAYQGDLARSGQLFAESLAIRRALSDQWGVANSLNNLGELALMQERYAEAHPYLEEAVTIYRAIGDRWSLGNTVLTLGNVLRAQGAYQAAYPLYQESLQIYRGLGDRRSLAYLLESIGGLLSLRGDAVRAIRLAAAAAALRETLQTPLSPAEEGQLAQALAQARAALDVADAAMAWQAGSELTVEEAIAEALATDSLT